MAGDAFSKFKSSFNRGITTISVKASSSLEKSKIKTHIESLESEIQKMIFSIGEQAYAKWENKDSDFSSLNETFEQIDRKKQEIESLTAELNSIDERDSQILGNAKNEDGTRTDSSVCVCPNCGMRYDEPVRFCRSCGFKLQ